MRSSIVYAIETWTSVTMYVFLLSPISSNDVQLHPFDSRHFNDSDCELSFIDPSIFSVQQRNAVRSRGPNTHTHACADGHEKYM
jgi:hypothetical protein